jgi:hypothetical protein
MRDGNGNAVMTATRCGLQRQRSGDRNKIWDGDGSNSDEHGEIWDGSDSGSGEHGEI